MTALPSSDATKGTKRLLLVFPPFCSPAIISNGIAYLIAFIKKYEKTVLPEFYDANLDFHDSVLNRRIRANGRHCSQKGECKNHFCVHYLNECFSVKQLLNNKQVIKDTSFLGTETYSNAVHNIRFIFGTYYHCFNRWCEDIVNDRIDVDTWPGSSFSPLIKRITKSKPHVVGFSVFTHTQLIPTLAISKILKEEMDVEVVIGGAFVPYVDVESILRHLSCVDYISLGEGEKCLQGILRSWKLEDIPGLCYRGAGGEVATNQNQYIENLDGIPFPDYSQFDLGEYYHSELILPLLGSRNCPYGKCSFCSHRCNYGPYRKRAVEKILDEIEYSMERYQTKNFEFRDEEILSSRYREIVEGLKKRRLKVFMSGYMRPTKSYGEDLIKEIYSAGFRFLIIGLEATSPRILELMNKGIDAEHAKKAVNWCLKAGIICQINLISNFPGCSYDVYREQAEYFENLAGRFKNFYLAILPFFVAYKSDIYYQPNDYFIKDLKPKCFLKIGGKEILNFNNIEFNYMLQENEDNMSRLRELDKELMKINADHLLTFSREEKILLKRYTSQRKDLPASEIGRVDPFIASLFEMLEP